MKKVLLGCGVMVAVCVTALFCFVVWLGMRMESGAIPDSAVVTGNQLSTEAREAIASVVTLRPGETIQYFYCSAMFDWTADGNLVTNQRVLSYQQDEELFISEADYVDITDVTPTYGSWPDDTSLIVQTKQKDVFMLFFSNENDVDQAAIAYIEQQLPNNGGP